MFTCLFIYFFSFSCISIRDVNHLSWFDYLFIFYSFVLLLVFISVVCLIYSQVLRLSAMILYIYMHIYLFTFYGGR